ncbi:MAG: hypothetical protein RIC35_21820 [Marinoscillum sp.]
MKPTDEELAILTDVRFLRLKNELSEKIIRYLAQIERSLHKEVQQAHFHFPEGTFLKAGKISKGEQYKELPYFILDYPRLFTQKEVFAFRTMLWWGHHFSATLHLHGEILTSHKEQIVKKLAEDKGLYFCINESPWEYHYDPDNYLLINDLEERDLIRQIEQNGFIKISSFIPLTAWSKFSSFTIESFARFLKCLKAI